jgi:dihydrofolate reductase
MRKLIATEFYTLDGLMSDPKDKMDWVTGTFNDEMGTYEYKMYNETDTLFLGAVTYKIFESYWPHAADNPNTPPGDVALAHLINKARKIVFSRSLKSVSWQNSEVRPAIDPEEIRKMKKLPGKNMLLVGSASIVQQMTNLGLIDEYHLLMHPVILGKGKPLFKDIPETHKLFLIGTKDFGNGVVMLTYSTK